VSTGTGSIVRRSIRLRADPLPSCHFHAFGRAAAAAGRGLVGPAASARTGPAARARNLARGLCPFRSGPVRPTACPSGQRLKSGPVHLPMSVDPSLECRRVRAESCGVRYDYVRPGPSARRPLPSSTGPRLLWLAPPAATVSSPRLTGRQFPGSVPRGSRAVSAPGQFPVAHEPSVPRVRSPRLTGRQLPSQTPWRTGRQFPESAPSEPALVGTFGQRADGTPVWPPSGESSCVSSRAGSSRAGMACGFPCRCEVRMIREYDTTALPASGPALLPDPPGPGRGIRYEYDTTALPASGPALLPGPRGPGRVLPHLRGSRLVRSRPKPVPSATGGYTALAHESGSGREAMVGRF
jgi:hypothetical protein